MQSIPTDRHTGQNQPQTVYHFGAILPGHEAEKGFFVEVRRGQQLAPGTIRLRPGGRHAVPRLLEQLKHNDRYERESACSYLGELGAEAATAVPDLQRLLRADKHNTVRFSAAAALGKIGPKAQAAVPDLIVALHHNTDGVDREAATALGLIGDASAVPALARALAKEDRDVRRATIVALGQLAEKSPKAIPSLIAALKDKDSAVQKSAITWLGKTSAAAKSAAGPLIDLVEKGPHYLRPVAAEALGQIGDRSALPVLKRALSDPDDALFRAAAIALGRMK